MTDLERAKCLSPYITKDKQHIDFARLNLADTNELYRLVESINKAIKLLQRNGSRNDKL